MREKFTKFLDLHIGNEVNLDTMYYEVQLIRLYQSGAIAELQQFFLSNKERLVTLLGLNEQETKFLTRLLSDNSDNIDIISINKSFKKLYHRVVRKDIEKKIKKLKPCY